MVTMVDFQRFYNACDPTRTLNMGNSEDEPYYIDFAPVRGNSMVQQIERTITILSPNSKTCQLFSGHIGCGKSTELLLLKEQLEKSGFFVVYFESTQDLDVADVDVTDVLLAIARQVSLSLEDAQLFVEPRGFQKLLKDTVDFLSMPELSAEFEQGGKKFAVDKDGFSVEMPVVVGPLSVGIASITAKAKNSSNLRSRLRGYLEPQTSTLLRVINEELLAPAKALLKQRSKNGIVVIIDNLDRVIPTLKPSGKLQTEYLFVDRGGELRGLDCHLVYTVPLMLLFSSSNDMLKNRLGGGMSPKVLPMVRVRSRDGSDDVEGMQLLRQMVLVRAFPELAKTPEKLIAHSAEVFDSLDTLDRLCRISGGHVRNVMALLYACLQQDDPPISRSTLDRVIQDDRDRLVVTIDEEEWAMIFRVVQQQILKGEQEAQILLPNMYVYEYSDSQGRWFNINPVLEETTRFQSWQKQTTAS